mgnify:CR=1 FL=1
MSEYLVEFIPQGRYVKVTAVDPLTGVEAVIVGDASQTQQTLQRLAVQKLEFLLKKSR